MRIGDKIKKKKSIQPARRFLATSPGNKGQQMQDKKKKIQKIQIKNVQTVKGEENTIETQPAGQHCMRIANL